MRNKYKPTLSPAVHTNGKHAGVGPLELCHVEQAKPTAKASRNQPGGRGIMTINGRDIDVVSYTIEFKDPPQIEFCDQQPRYVAGPRHVSITLDPPPVILSAAEFEALKADRQLAQADSLYHWTRDLIDEVKAACDSAGVPTHEDGGGPALKPLTPQARLKILATGEHLKGQPIVWPNGEGFTGGYLLQSTAVVGLGGKPEDAVPWTRTLRTLMPALPGPLLAMQHAIEDGLAESMKPPADNAACDCDQPARITLTLSDMEAADICIHCRPGDADACEACGRPGTPRPPKFWFAIMLTGNAWWSYSPIVVARTAEQLMPVPARVGWPDGSWCIERMPDGFDIGQTHLVVVAKTNLIAVENDEGLYAIDEPTLHARIISKRPYDPNPYADEIDRVNQEADNERRQLAEQQAKPRGWSNTRRRYELYRLESRGDRFSPTDVKEGPLFEALDIETLGRVARLKGWHENEWGVESRLGGPNFNYELQTRTPGTDQGTRPVLWGPTADGLAEFAITELASNVSMIIRRNGLDCVWHRWPSSSDYRPLLGSGREWLEMAKAELAGKGPFQLQPIADDISRPAHIRVAAEQLIRESAPKFRIDTIATGNTLPDFQATTKRILRDIAKAMGVPPEKVSATTEPDGFSTDAEHDTPATIAPGRFVLSQGCYFPSGNRYEIGIGHKVESRSDHAGDLLIAAYMRGLTDGWAAEWRVFDTTTGNSIPAARHRDASDTLPAGFPVPEASDMAIALLMAHRLKQGRGVAAVIHKDTRRTLAELETFDEAANAGMKQKAVAAIISTFNAMADAEAGHRRRQAIKHGLEKAAKIAFALLVSAAVIGAIVGIGTMAGRLIASSSAH